MTMDSGIQTIYGDPLENYRAVIKSNIVYGHRETMTLHLQLMGPDIRMTKKTYPLVIWVNAGGWARPDSFAELPQLAELAHRGYMVASIEHRGINRDGNVQDGAAFPDAILDLKEAIRFLKANSQVYGIDPNRIALMGNAVGAHSALMAALTYDDTEHDIGEYREQSSQVHAVIDLFGQADLVHMVEDRLERPDHKDFDILENDYPIEMLRLFGLDQTDYDRQMVLASPVTYISKEKAIPPMLIVHDEGNHVVPLKQSVRLFTKLRECGKKVEMYKVVGATFMRGLWTKELMELIIRFLDATLVGNIELL